MNEFELDKVYRRGEQGRGVKRIQEWLTLQGFAVAIDGDFGAATEAALKRFQAKAGLSVSGVADAVTFDRLIAPMKAAIAPIPAQGRSLGSLVVAHASQHLAQRPREIGGENQGPWVRLYMDGNEGPAFAWCAGFVTFCLQQAARSLGVPMPVERTFSCDLLAAFGREKGRFLSGPTASPDRTLIRPGSLFLRRRTASDWEHAGIVTEVDEETFQTIEGNTNDQGDREGYEVCARTRGFKNMDFVLL
ncbi:peptidoglycan-binding protein [Pyxidicoccus fallax]|uniref:Peptidoglycan-binding protein n=1 Tax=Pyxidicoccus fallax TaxID=394095 RepID=A0A848LIH3_9BACT|nr:peptidoglycan-binding domain-containing protein [Pyxidicoccus fallax]NMO17508.1 peptidoglycan-binding protein [Pyxidicoccus fallax]NPC81913.1 peptidoglycan-binding protein [Pyxidicoccus fallax]